MFWTNLRSDGENCGCRSVLLPLFSMRLFLQKFQIAQGGEIPKEYYLKGKVAGKGQKSTEAVIKAGDSLTVTFDRPTDKPGRVIR